MRVLVVTDSVFKLVDTIRKNSIPHAENLPRKIVDDLANAVFDGEMYEVEEFALNKKIKKV